MTSVDSITKTEATAKAEPADMKLEVVLLGVADVDRAKAFYRDQVGFQVEQDVRMDDAHRFVELVPPRAG